MSKKTHWALTLTNSGFSGITFSKRKDVKLGLRPIPYYEIDGDLELLKEIKNHLFKYGINSTLTETKYFNALQVIGMDNCLILSEVIGVNDRWANSLREEFQRGAHLTEKGIKKLFIKFGNKSLLTYDEVCEIIDAAKVQRLNETMKKIFEKRVRLKLLPAFDNLYKQYDIANMCCMQCNAKDVKIYFIGKYPRVDTTFFLCDSCYDTILNPPERKERAIIEYLHKTKNKNLKRRIGKQRDLLIASICDVCHTGKPEYVYGFGDKPKHNISLCQGCWELWEKSYILYRPESTLENRMFRILDARFSNYSFKKQRVGQLTPDFVCQEKNKIIEVFGCYWHACSLHFPDRQINGHLTYEYRAKYFGSHGYETLFVWGHDFQDERILVDRIEVFLST